MWMHCFEDVSIFNKMEKYNYANAATAKSALNVSFVMHSNQLYYSNPIPYEESVKMAQSDW